MKNSANAKYKFSSLESKTNNAILLILATQLIMSMVGSLVGSTWTYYSSQPSIDREECNSNKVPNWCLFDQAYYLALD
jgi:phospholipid-transporting ATPase